jgi:hypothetical protein
MAHLEWLVAGWLNEMETLQSLGWNDRRCWEPRIGDIYIYLYLFIFLFIFYIYIYIYLWGWWLKYCKLMPVVKRASKSLHWRSDPYGFHTLFAFHLYLDELTSWNHRLFFSNAISMAENHSFDGEMFYHAGFSRKFSNSRAGSLGLARAAAIAFTSAMVRRDSQD